MQSSRSVTQFQKLQKIQLANAVDNFAILASHHKITFTEVAQGIRREPGVLFRFANGNFGSADLRMIYEIANYFGHDIDTFITTTPDEILKIPATKSKSLVALTHSEIRTNIINNTNALASHQNIDLDSLLKKYKIPSLDGNGYGLLNLNHIQVIAAELGQSVESIISPARMLPKSDPSLFTKLVAKLAKQAPKVLLTAGTGLLISAAPSFAASIVSDELNNQGDTLLDVNLDKSHPTNALRLMGISTTQIILDFILLSGHVIDGAIKYPIDNAFDGNDPDQTFSDAYISAITHQADLAIGIYQGYMKGAKPIIAHGEVLATALNDLGIALANRIYASFIINKMYQLSQGIAVAIKAKEELLNFTREILHLSEKQARDLSEHIEADHSHQHDEVSATLHAVSDTATVAHMAGLHLRGPLKYIGKFSEIIAEIYHNPSGDLVERIICGTGIALVKESINTYVATQSAVIAATASSVASTPVGGAAIGAMVGITAYKLSHSVTEPVAHYAQHACHDAFQSLKDIDMNEITKRLDAAKQILTVIDQETEVANRALPGIEEEINDRKKRIDTHEKKLTAPDLSHTATTRNKPQIDLNSNERLKQWYSDNDVEKLLSPTDTVTQVPKKEVSTLKSFEVLKQEQSKRNNKPYTHEPFPIQTNLKITQINPLHVKSNTGKPQADQHLMNNANLMSNIAAIPTAHQPSAGGMFSSKGFNNESKILSPNPTDSSRQYSSISRKELPSLANLAAPRKQTKPFMNQTVSTKPIKNVAFEIEILQSAPPKQQYECVTLDNQNYKRFLYSGGNNSVGYFKVEQPGTYCRPAGSHDVKDFRKKPEFDLGKRM